MLRKGRGFTRLVGCAEASAHVRRGRRLSGLVVRCSGTSVKRFAPGTPPACICDWRERTWATNCGTCGRTRTRTNGQGRRPSPRAEVLVVTSADGCHFGWPWGWQIQATPRTAAERIASVNKGAPPAREGRALPWPPRSRPRIAPRRASTHPRGPVSFRMRSVLMERSRKRPFTSLDRRRPALMMHDSSWHAAGA